MDRVHHPKAIQYNISYDYNCNQYIIWLPVDKYIIWLQLYKYTIYYNCVNKSFDYNCTNIPYITIVQIYHMITSG